MSKIKPGQVDGTIKTIYVECILMQNGEVIHLGQSLGFVKPDPSNGDMGIGEKYIFEKDGD